jgi:hypothetical protein
MAKLYLHSPICLRGIELNQLSTEKNLLYQDNQTREDDMERVALVDRR